MKYTPGPWHVSRTGMFIRHNLGDGFVPNICGMDVFGGPPEEREANARLIAAAPELLEALKLSQEIMLNLGWAVSLEGRKREVYESVSAAIKKAEGK